MHGIMYIYIYKTNVRLKYSIILVMLLFISAGHFKICATVLLNLFDMQN